MYTFKFSVDAQAVVLEDDWEVPRDLRYANYFRLCPLGNDLPITYYCGRGIALQLYFLLYNKIEACVPWVLRVRFTAFVTEGISQASDVRILKMGPGNKR